MTDITELIAEHRSGHALTQPFYNDAEIYTRDIDQIFFNSWLYVGHISQIPKLGDYFLFEIAAESVIIAHSETDTVHALINVCRHRGSRVCLQPSGHTSLFICGYHGWSYQLDGTLRGANHTAADFDKSAYGLKKIAVEVFHGMIFVNFAPEPADFAAIHADLDKPMRPFGLAQAKVAHRQNYAIAANWKLAIENYCECYHCAPAHPEYSISHGRAIAHQEMVKLTPALQVRSRQAGMSTKSIDFDWTNAGGFGVERGFDRYPLLQGYLTGSRDGRPVAPLLGDITDYDGGATDIHIGPPTFFLAYSDHFVAYRFTPRAVDKTDCEITWLVNADAVEGRDYQREELIWLWDVTTIADKTIIENNQAGVDSRYYKPGPYTPMEDFTGSFIDWYLAALERPPAS